MSDHAILLIEDDAGVRESLKDLLEMEGFAVYTAENGEVGLRVMESIGSPCLILLDLMMPVMDGWTFLENLRSSGSDAPRAKIPVAVVSAAVDVADVERRYGCQVIPKPVDINRLLDTAQQFCRCDS